MDVPEGYAIKVLALQNNNMEGTAFADFQSLNYTPQYDFFGTSANYFIIRSMGPILQGSLITIVFKAYKNSITNFYVDVYIDTEAIITAGASSYMFFGRATAQSQDSDDFYQYLRTSPQFEYDRASSEMTGSEYLLLYFHSYPATSTGSYVEIYLSPKI